MPLHKLPYKNLRSLLDRHLEPLEDPETEKLIRRLAGVGKRGYLTKPELIEICRWKSPRAIGRVRRNRPDFVKKLTVCAFRTRNERKRLEYLVQLHGVGVPTASAILTLTNPKRYGVIDIRVWQLLYRMKAVDANPGGAGISLDQWCRFLSIVRYYARMLHVDARTVERTLFSVHLQYQEGRLYAKRSVRPGSSSQV